MESGMATASRRQVIDQVRHPKGRSSFSPAPVRATMTTSSVSRSVTSGWTSGWGTSALDKLKTAKPKATQNMGRESGSSRSAMGSQATSRISAPAPTSSKM
jgi:hypothetical protein